MIFVVFNADEQIVNEVLKRLEQKIEEHLIIKPERRYIYY